MDNETINLQGKWYYIIVPAFYWYNCQFIKYLKTLLRSEGFFITLSSLRQNIDLLWQNYNNSHLPLNNWMYFSSWTNVERGDVLWLYIVKVKKVIVVFSLPIVISTTTSNILYYCWPFVLQLTICSSCFCMNYNQCHYFDCFISPLKGDQQYIDIDLLSPIVIKDNCQITYRRSEVREYKRRSFLY